MKIKYFLKKKMNHRTTETSADVLLATLITSGWFVSLVVYLIVK